MRHILVGSIAIAALYAGPSQHLPRLLPVDATNQDDGLRSTRDAVLLAAKTRSVDSLLLFVSTKIDIGEGADPAEALRSVVHRLLSDPKHEWWSGLEDALSLGGAFTTSRGAVEGRREFCAPYYYAGFPTELPVDVQGERTPWVVIDKDVAVHTGPDAMSPVVARWSYVMVQAEGGAQRDPVNRDVIWQTVSFPAESESFVLSRKIRNPEGFHVCFAQEAGKWYVSAIASHHGL